jgi:hypothetical protein
VAFPFGSEKELCAVVVKMKAFAGLVGAEFCAFYCEGLCWTTSERQQFPTFLGGSWLAVMFQYDCEVSGLPSVDEVLNLQMIHVCLVEPHGRIYFSWQKGSAN